MGTKQGWALLAVAGLGLTATNVSAQTQVAPVGAHHAATSEPSHGGGGLPSSVPIDLPDSRGGLPQPLRFALGGMGLGACGGSCDVPLSFIRESTSFAYRRPIAQPGQEPAVRPEVVLSLPGATLELVQDGNVWVPKLGPSTLTAQRVGPTLWYAYDGNGLTYTFNIAPITGFVLLSRIEGPGGTRVELDYEIEHPSIDQGEGTPQFDATTIDLVSVSYNHSPSGSPKHVVSLGYGAVAATPLSMRLEGERVVVRRRVLEHVDITSRAQPGDSLLQLARYAFHYQANPDTLQPRLKDVTLSGQQGTPEADRSLPVVRYEFGSATVNKPDGTPGRTLRYQTQYTVPMPASPNTGADAQSIGAAATWVYQPNPFAPGVLGNWALFQTLVDMGGDGRADFVQLANPLNPQAPMTHVVARNVPGVGGVTSFPVSATSPMNNAAMPDGPLHHLTVELMSSDEDLYSGVPGGYLGGGVFTHTWRKLIDVNNDGRPDIVDAAALDNYRWLVFLNTPDPVVPQNIKWVRRTYDVSHLKNLLKDHVVFALKPTRVPLEQRKVGIDEANIPVCFEYDYSTNEWVDKLQAEVSSAPWDNWQGAAGCVAGRQPNIGRRSVMIYKVMDVNGDGGLDFVKRSIPAKKGIVIERPCYRDATQPLQPGSTTCHIPPPHHRVAGGWREHRVLDATVRVAFHHGAPLDAIPNSAEVDFGGCGIDDWAINGWHEEGFPQQACSLQDINGDRLADSIEANVVVSTDGVDVGSARAYLGTGRRISKGYVVLPSRASWSPDSAGLPGDPQVERTHTSFVDVTGDGLRDFVERDAAPGQAPRWWVHIGTGTGFTAPTPIQFDANGFELSWGGVYSTVDVKRTGAGLYEMDGDGRADFVYRHIGSGGNELRVAQVVGSDGPGALAAGRLTEVDNGRGMRTKITYANAKVHNETRHQVPAPEIVVASVKTLQASNGHVTQTRYAYGNPIFGYDIVAGRFRSFGYERTVAVTEVEAGKGNATITDNYPLIPFTSVANVSDMFERFLEAGRRRDVTTLSGNVSDPWALLNLDLATDPRRIGARHYDYSSRSALALAYPNTPAYCVGNDPYEHLGTNQMMNTCNVRGFIFTSGSSSWHGDVAPGIASVPPDQNVTSDSHVKTVDALGRVTLAYAGGDSRRSDDNACIYTTYAEPPANTYPRVLSALASVTVGGASSNGTCGGALLSAHRAYYDGLPAGVTDGFLTSHVVDRIEGGVVKEEIQTFEAQYDARGHLVEHTSQSGDGRTLSWTVDTFDAFGLLGTGSHITATGAPQLTSSVTLDPLTLQPVSATDPNGLSVGMKYDGFGRPTVSTVTPPGGVAGAFSYTQYLGDDGNFSGEDPDGPRRIIEKSFDNPVSPNTVSVALGHAVTTTLDDAGRPTTVVVDLGSDYGDDANDDLVSAVVYDEFGRVAFAADPFPADPFPADQSAATAYGTTYLYNLDGTLKCAVRGHGPQADVPGLTVATDEAAERYPSCVTHRYGNGQALSLSYGADSLLAGSAQAGVYSQTATSALGRVLSHSTWKGAARLQHTELEHDGLGQLTVMKRFKNPSALSEWTGTYFNLDSLGQVVRQHDQASVAHVNTYSSWGELIKSETEADERQPLRQAQLWEYDGLSRLTHTEQSQDGTLIPGTSYDYTYDSAVPVHPAVPLEHMLGRLATASAATSTMYFGYDAFGRPVATAHQAPDQKLYVETAQYDGDGTVSELSVLSPDTGHQEETVTYDYDSARRVTGSRFTDQNGQQRELYRAVTIDKLGRVRDARVSGATVQMDYADIGRRLLREARVLSPSGRLWQLTPNGDDPVGRERGRTERKDNEQEITTPTYDPLGRLIASMRSNATTTLAHQTFAYDALGNLLAKQDLLSNHDVSMQYRDDNRDQLCSIGYGSAAPTTCNVTHDALGNIVKQPTAQGLRTLSYLPSGLVSRIVQPQATVTFKYGAFDEVDEVDVQSTTTDPRRDRRYGSFEQRDHGNGQTTLSRSFPIGLGMASRHGPGDMWGTELGELRGIRLSLGADGEPTQAIDYEAYGETTSSGVLPSAPNYSRAQWNGGDNLEALRLTHLQARTYDPEIGRFLSPDPLISGTSAYAFAKNDPVNYADPRGLSPTSTVDKEWLERELKAAGLSAADIEAALNGEVVSVYSSAPPDKSGNSPGYDIERELWHMTDGRFALSRDPSPLNVPLSAAEAKMEAHRIKYAGLDLDGNLVDERAAYETFVLNNSLSSGAGAAMSGLRAFRALKAPLGQPVWTMSPKQFIRAVENGHITESGRAIPRVDYVRVFALDHSTGGRPHSIRGWSLERRQLGAVVGTLDVTLDQTTGRLTVDMVYVNAEHRHFGFSANAVGEAVLELERTTGVRVKSIFGKFAETNAELHSRGAVTPAQKLLETLGFRKLKWGSSDGHVTLEGFRE